MSTQDDNNKNIKSKIEQIRIDLEKKLSNIEDSKSNDSNKVLDKEKESLIDKIEKKLEKKMSKDTSDLDSPLSFELSEPVEKAEEKKQVKSEKKPIADKIFLAEGKINKTKFIEDSKNKEKLSSNANNDVKTLQNKEIVKATNKITKPPKTVITSLSKGVSDNEDTLEYVEYEEKKSKKSFLLYGLIILLFGIVFYFVTDYINKNKELNNEIMHQKLSKFKNKRYLDSIELVDLNNQLVDLQSEKELDSLDNIYEQELIANSKKYIKTFKQNFNITKEERINNENKKSSSNNLSQIGVASKSNKKSISDKKNEKLPDSNLSNESNVDGIASSSEKNNEDKSINNTKIGVSKVTKSTEAAKSIKTAKSTEVVAEKSIKPSSSDKNKRKFKKVPIYPGCNKEKTEIDKRHCLTSKMHKFVRKNFNNYVAANSGLKNGIYKVRVSFIIDKAGYVTALGVRGDTNSKIEEEAIRVVQSMPRMKAATLEGKKTSMKYNIPISFAIEN